MKLQENQNLCLIGFLRRYPIQYRLFLICLILSFFPVFGIGFYAYRLYSVSLNARIGQSTSQAVNLLGQNLLLEISPFSNYASSLSVSDEIQDVLTNTYLEAVEDGERTEVVLDIMYDLAAQRLHTAIDSSLVNSGYLANIRVTDRDGRILYDLLYPENQQGVVSYLEEINRTRPNDSLQYAGWARGHELVILGRSLRNLYGENEPIGYFLFYIDQRLITDKLFSKVSFGPGSKILLLSARNKSLISSSDPGLGTEEPLISELSEKLIRNTGQNMIFNARLGSEDCLVVAQYLSDFDEYMTVLIPEKSIHADVNVLSGRLALVGFFFFLVTLTLTMIIYASIMSPISWMTTYCKRISSDFGQLDKRIADTGADELTLLSNTIDSMVGNIQGLMIQKEADERRKRELELERLHYQINPHFLFNTLDTLKWISDGHEVPVLARGIGALSALLKSTIVDKSEYISIAREVEILSSYVEIQKIRYAEGFFVIWDLDESLMDIIIPRFTLQPLVENAIMHGSYDSGEEMEILISFRKEAEFLILKVKDTGRGFESLGPCNVLAGKFQGIGLSNVVERLRLHYGDEASLSIESSPGKGTFCRIALPFNQLSREEKP